MAMSSLSGPIGESACIDQLGREVQPFFKLCIHPLPLLMSDEQPIFYHGK